MVGREDRIGGDGQELVVIYGYLGGLCLILSLFHNVDIIRDSLGVSVVALHLGGKVHDVYGVQASTVIVEVHQYFGGCNLGV